MTLSEVLNHTFLLLNEGRYFKNGYSTKVQDIYKPTNNLALLSEADINCYGRHDEFMKAKDKLNQNAIGLPEIVDEVDIYLCAEDPEVGFKYYTEVLKLKKKD